MDLREFISQSLSSILNGIQDAHAKIDTKLHDSAIYHIGQNDNDSFNQTEKIDFQIAVTVAQSEKSSAGAKVSVLSLGGAGGEIGSDSQQTHQNIIRFSVPVLFTRFKPPSE